VYDSRASGLQTTVAIPVALHRALRILSMPSKHPCPCCGFLTLEERAPGTFAICPVCFWEDDDVQFHDPDLEGGANAVSLTRARENFRAFGASSQACVDLVRPPRPSETPPNP
jgi:hypothetical protein